MRTVLLSVLAVGVVIAAAFAFADEQIEHLVAPEEGALRPPDGEWIKSVPGDQAEIWAVGDADPPASAGVARLIRRADPDRILYLGDVYPMGHAPDFTRWAKPWHGLLGRMAPTPGNHDWGEAREGYEPFWRKVTGETPPTYYAFKAAGWQILSVNSEHDDQDAVRDWLRHKVRSGGNCRIAFWHSPRYSAGHHPGSEAGEGLWKALQGGARLIVNGHDHNMQRIHDKGGVVELVSGAGGRTLYGVHEESPLLAFSDDKHYGAVRMSLRPGHVRWRFVTRRGKVLDSGTLSCRA